MLSDRINLDLVHCFFPFSSSLIWCASSCHQRSSCHLGMEAQGCKETDDNNFEKQTCHKFILFHYLLFVFFSSADMGESGGRKRREARHIYSIFCQWGTCEKYRKHDQCPDNLDGALIYMFIQVSKNLF